MEEELNECGMPKNKIKDFVTWAPYIELLQYMRKNKGTRMSYFYFVDTDEGEEVEKQLRISI